VTLPTVGTAKYETISGVAEFDAMSHSKVTSRTVYSDSGRVVKYCEWRIEITGTVALISVNGSESLDNRIMHLRRVLTDPGGILTFNRMGFGGDNGTAGPNPLVVNGASGLKDVNWGPKPELLSYLNLGGSNAAEVVWVVTVCVNEYHNAVPASSQGQLLVYECSTGFSVDRSGLATLKFSGHLEIAITRENNSERTVTHSAEEYREKARPELPLGFAPEQQEFNVSADQRRADFSYVYQQVPAPLPPGVTHFPLEHTLESSLVPDAFVNFNGSLSGTIMLPVGVDKSVLGDYIIFTILSKVAINSLGKTAAVLKKNRTMLPLRFRVTDDVHGLGATFQFNYKIFGSSLEEIFSNVHLFNRLRPDITFDDWRKSLLGDAWSVFGATGWHSDTPYDKLIDLRDTQDPQPPKMLRRNILRSFDPDNGEGKNDTVEDQYSWILFSNHFHYSENGEEIKSTVRHRPLGGIIDQGNAIVDALANKVGVGTQVTKLRELRNSVFHTLQRIGLPNYEVEMHGKALRMGLAIPQVGLKSIEGVVIGEGPSEIKEQIVDYVPSTEVAKFGTLKIYGSTWVIRYTLTNQLKRQMSPDNYQFRDPGLNAANFVLF
jgi:hypothetical protein